MYVGSGLWPEDETSGSFIKADVDSTIKTALYDATIALGNNKWLNSLQQQFHI